MSISIFTDNRLCHCYYLRSQFLIPHELYSITLQDVYENNKTADTTIIKQQQRQQQQHIQQQHLQQQYIQQQQQQQPQQPQNNNNVMRLRQMTLFVNKRQQKYTENNR